VRKPLCDPALHSPGRDRYDLPGQRVVQRLEEHIAEGVDQIVGPSGPVEAKHPAKARRQV
jgi:hypothetical protein